MSSRPPVSPTGAKADHRLAVPAHQMEAVARELASQLGVNGSSANAGELKDKQVKWLSVVAGALKKSRGRCVVIAGYDQPWQVQLLAHAMNESLGNRGQNGVSYKAYRRRKPGGRHFPCEARQGHAGRPGGMPDRSGEQSCVFRAGRHRVSKSMQKVPFRFHVGLYQDETARQCHWHLPLAHYLESWEDARAFDGTTSLIQPLIEPLYDNISLAEMTRFLSAHIETPGRQIVREYWQNEFQQSGSEANGANEKNAEPNNRKKTTRQTQRGHGIKRVTSKSRNDNQVKPAKAETPAQNANEKQNGKATKQSNQNQHAQETNAANGQKDQNAQNRPGKDQSFEDFWETALHDGLVRGVREREFPPKDVKMQEGWQQKLESNKLGFPSGRRIRNRISDRSEHL